MICREKMERREMKKEGEEVDEGAAEEEGVGLMGRPSRSSSGLTMAFLGVGRGGVGWGPDAGQS